MTDFSKDYGPDDNEFPSDDYRRVIGVLGVPRSLDGVVRALDLDNSAPRLGISNSKRVTEVLADCVDSGWVTQLGDSMVPEDVLAEANASKDAIDVPAPRGEAFVERASAGRSSSALGEGPKYIISKAGRDKARGPIPNEPPPLTGNALIRALEANVELAQEAVDAEHAAEDRTAEQVQAAEDVLLTAQAALEAASNGGK